MKYPYTYKVTYWYKEDSGYWTTKHKVFEYTTSITDEQLRKDFSNLVGTVWTGFVFAKYEEIK